MNKIYTLDTEMFFQLPEYNGKEYRITSKRGGNLLARLTCDGKLFILEGYQWRLGRVMLDNRESCENEMYLSSLVLDVLRQMYRLNHGYFAYSKSVIHKVYLSNMKQSRVAKWKRCCYYTLCKVRALWKGTWWKWRV